MDNIIKSETFSHTTPSGTYVQTVTLHGQYDANNGTYCGTMAGGDDINIPTFGFGGMLTAYIEPCGGGFTSSSTSVSGAGHHYWQTGWISVPGQGYTQGEYSSNAGDWIDKVDFCFNG